MKRVILLLLFTCLSVGYISAQAVKATKASGSQSTPGAVKWIVGNESMPGHIQAFQENKGQFLNTTNDWSIKYGVFYDGSYILFTDHGILNVMPKSVPLTANEIKKIKATESKTEEQDGSRQLNKIVYETVSVEWENANTNSAVEGITLTPYYFGTADPLHTGKSIDSIKGYKKIVYHNLYPGIDVEFTFHAGKGIEYTLKVKPGADPSYFKMKYNGQERCFIDDTGNVHLTTSIGDIIDHAPVTMQDGMIIGSSFEKLSANEAGFKLKSYDRSKELIIDPWTVNPTTGVFIPSNTAMDAANNVYITGSYAPGFNQALTMYEQKYTAGGALSWTYAFNQLVSTGFRVTNIESDLAVDPAGNSYVPAPYYYSNANSFVYAMVSLNTAGTQRYFYNTFGNDSVFEIWNITYSCSGNKLIQAGAGPAAQQGQVAVVTPSNGNLGGVYTGLWGSPPGEVYAGSIAPSNGYYYGLASALEFTGNTPTDQLLCWNITGSTPALLWQINCGYSFDDFEIKNPYGIGNNAIASGCAYLYTTDGLVLQQRSLTTGAVNTSVNLPGGNNGHAGEDNAGPGNDNSGVAVDLQCGNVYAGSINAVYIYDQNLNAITSVAAPGTVLDVKFGNSLVAACGYNGTSGFVMQFAAQQCPGLTITHTNGSCKTLATATVSTPTFCTGPYTYLWSPGGQTTQTATGLSTGVYTVTIGTATSCVTVTDTVTIFSAGVVNVTAISTGSACTGTATATATGGASPYTYSWNSGQTTSVITAVPAGTYTCTVTDINGCIGNAIVTVNTSGPAVSSTTTNVICFGGKSGGASLTVTGGTPGYTYKWSSGQTTSSVAGLAAGNYTCTVTDKGGCSDIVTLSITQPAQIRDSLVSSSDDKCFGDKNGQVVVGVAGGANPLSYSWNNGSTNLSDTGLAAGTYTLTVTDANGCVSTITETIKQPTQITGTVTGQNMCSGQSATLNATGTGGTPGYTYSWNGVNGGSTYTVSPLVTTTYTLQVTDANGCKSAQSPITVVVNPSPNVLFVPDTLDGCYPLCVKFKDQTTVAGGTVKKWYWTFGNGDTSTMQNPVICYGKPGVYTISLTATSNSGCTSNLIIPNLITVYDHPHADFTAAPQPVNIMNPFVQFTDKTVDQYGIQSYFWTLGDATDSTSTSPNPGHTYHDTGTFCPTLVVTNVHQCTDSIEHCIVIDPLFTLYIPNAFTPNNDGNDDVFLPKGIYVCSFEMYIFDRWGQELFHTTDLFKGWNGKVNSSGKVSQEDTYVYLIYATDCETHSKHSYIGKVTLLK